MVAWPTRVHTQTASRSVQPFSRAHGHVKPMHTQSTEHRWNSAVSQCMRCCLMIMTTALLTTWTLWPTSHRYFCQRYCGLYDLQIDMEEYKLDQLLSRSEAALLGCVGEMEAADWRARQRDRPRSVGQRCHGQAVTTSPVCGCDTCW